VTVREAAKHACVCESIVRSWVSSGQLPHSRVGTLGKRGKILIAEEDLDGFLANFKVEKKGPEQKAAPAPVPITPLYRHVRLS
jgi:excisionase family DNA binding protein